MEVGWEVGSGFSLQSVIGRVYTTTCRASSWCHHDPCGDGFRERNTSRAKSRQRLPICSRVTHISHALVNCVPYNLYTSTESSAGVATGGLAATFLNSFVKSVLNFK